MQLSPPSTITLTATCTTCGGVFAVNEHAAKHAHKGFMCVTCRRAGTGWQGKEAYAEYLKTYHWQGIRLKALRRAGDKCQVCASTDRLEVHHNDYARLGGELMTDLVVLCHECHKLFHGAQNGS